MSRHHHIDGADVPFTPAEEAAADAEQAAWAAGAAERARVAHNAAILAEISALDAKRVRPASEVSLALAQQVAPAQADLDRLAELTAEIASLRAGLL